MNNTAKKWVGYLEHQTNELLGIYTTNVGKGYCTIFSEMISQHYSHRNFTGVPWCAVFVHAVALETYGKETARQLLGKPHPGTRVLARRLKRSGRLRFGDYIPNPGDLIFLHNGDGKISHCGIVDRVEGDNLYSIEGNTADPTGVFEPNQGGAVAMRERDLTDKSIVAYGCLDDQSERSVKNQNG